MKRLLTESFRVSLHCSGKTFKIAGQIVLSSWSTALVLLSSPSSCLLAVLKLDKSFLTTKQLPSFSFDKSSDDPVIKFTSAHAQFNISNYDCLRNHTIRINRVVSPACNMSDPVSLVSGLQSRLQQCISKKYGSSSISWWILSLSLSSNIKTLFKY